MSLDVESLEPRIREILSTPGVDLSTISAKRVRKRLAELDSKLTVELLKEHKEEVDALIGGIFEEINSDEGKGEDAKSGHTTSEADYDNGEDSPPRPVKKVKKASKMELSDAEIAKQLNNQINGRASRRGASNGSGAKKGPRKVKKSADFIDTDESGNEGESGMKKRKRKSPTKKEGGGAKGGFAKEFMLSGPLAAVLNTPKLSRPQVVKQLWVYIKGNELQNPNNKREIMCDDGLREVFNCDKIDMFKMNKVLGMHLHEPGE